MDLQVITLQGHLIGLTLGYWAGIALAAIVLPIKDKKKTLLRPAVLLFLILLTIDILVTIIRF